MRNNIISGCLLILFGLSLFCGSALLLSGCGSPGETSAEVHRKHMNVVQTDMLQMQDDADAVLLLDRPSRLSEKVTR